MCILPDEQQLENIYKEINKTYFNNKLPIATILWDHLMLQPAKCITVENNNKKEYKIILSWKYHLLHNDEIIISLKHEMLHILYPEHNEQFQREAERIGTYIYAKLFNYPEGRYKYYCDKCSKNFYYDSINILLYCHCCLKKKNINNLLVFVGMRSWKIDYSDQNIYLTAEK